MSTKDHNEGYRLIQARAEAASHLIGHKLADAIHDALNSISAMSNIAKGNLDIKPTDLPPAPPKPPRRRSA